MYTKTVLQFIAVFITKYKNLGSKQSEEAYKISLVSKFRILEYKFYGI